MRSSRLIWAPRVVAIAYILFLSLFALDAFGADASFWTSFAGFLIHLIPSAILTILLVVSWRRPGVGACAFVLVAVLFTVFFETHEHLLSFLIISLPLVIVGCLFALTYAMSRRASYR